MRQADSSEYLPEHGLVVGVLCFSLGSFEAIWSEKFVQTIGTVKVSWWNDSSELSRSLSFVSFEILSMEIQFGFASLHWLVVCVCVCQYILVYIYIYIFIYLQNDP